jgi:coenzyme F420-reducing hydrogenase gamma subunit
LDTSTPVSAHVPVDYELHGCPIDRGQLLGLITALLSGRRPDIPGHSVCVQCKLRGTSCLLVTGAAPCLGPVTRAGCGGLCPSYARACFGCFGPADGANLPAMTDRLHQIGMADGDIVRALRTVTVGAPAFAQEAAEIEARS